MDVGGERAMSTEAVARERAVAHLSTGFVLDAATNGMADLATLDAILVMAINQANIAPLTRDPDARTRYGALDAPAPDEARRPVSISAVAASLGLPFETVRRRIKQLAVRGVCTLNAQGAVVPQAFLGSDAYLGTTRVLHERAWRFYRDCRAAGLLGELPPSHYSTETGVPIRGAARLIADYLLRSNEISVTRFGDVISGLIVMALLEAATAPQPAALSVGALAERLKIPNETLRRHVMALADKGFCARARGGVSIPESVLDHPGYVAALQENAVHVNRLFAGLAERGVIGAWEKLRPTGGALDLASRA